MISPDYCRLLARYNRWMNERLYATLSQMPDADRKHDRGAFFGSIHGTLSHILWGDRTWLGRFIDEPGPAPGYGAGLFPEFAELCREREITDHKISAWAGRLQPEWLASVLVYTGSADGRRREIPAAIAATHLFNHGTHHRGQVTAMMKQAGLDPGVTDLPGLPGLVTLLD